MSRSSSIDGSGLYRSRNGLILGVCRGIADYFDFSVFWIRAILIVVFILTGFWPIIGIYILAALLMKSEPVATAHEKTRTRSYSSRSTRYETAERLKRKWRQLEKRIRRMEDKVTSREFNWHNRFSG